MKRKAEFPKASLETAIGRVSLSMEAEFGPDCIVLVVGRGDDVPVVFQGHDYYTIHAYLERRSGRWSVKESDFSAYWSNEGMKRPEKPSEDERLALIDAIVPTALQYIDEHHEDFDRKKLERAIFEDCREQVILGLRQRVEALTEIANDAKDIASGPYSYCRGPAFANLRASLQAQSKELRTVARRTRTMARNVATMPA